MQQYDVAIIGAGPGGYVAAILAAKLGAKVALVEKDKIGGVCLNRGCIPTKAMIASAHALEAVRSSQKFGVKLNDLSPTIDFAAVAGRKDEIVSQLGKGIEVLLKGSKVEIIRGNATLNDPNTVSVDDNPIAAKNIIIATGSDWVALPNLNVDGKSILTSDHVLAWNSLPKSLVIVGGGVVGCEFACMLSAFGVQITIVEAMSSILPTIDAAVTRQLARTFKSKNIRVLTNTKVETSNIEGDEVKLLLSTKEEIISEKVLVAAGRRACTQKLNLENVGVELDGRGFIKVDETLKTSQKNIYAIGDCVGRPMLAHAASAQGVCAVENIMGYGKTYNFDVCPSPIFTTPEIACIGLTSQELEKKGIQFKTGKFPFMANGKAVCDGEGDGWATIYTDDSDKILGAHIVGPGAATLIAEPTLAMKNSLTSRDIAATIHAHPTLSEVVAEACEDSFGMAIHKVGGR